MTTPYTPPAPGAATGSSGGYNYNPADPYDLGTLASSPVILAQKETSATTNQYNYTPGHGPGVLGPGMLRANGVGGTPDSLTSLLSQGIEGKVPQSPIVTPSSTTTHGLGNVAETMTAYITDWMRLYASPKTRAEFNAVRGALADAGYYGSETWDRIEGRTAGLWDITAVKHAMQDWHTYASSTGAPMTFPDWLKAATGTGATSAKAKGPSVTLMDPNNIRMAAQNAAQQALGQGLSEDQLTAFVTQFQNEQVANAAKGTPEDPYSTSTKLPAEAMAFAQKSNPADFQSNQHQTFVDTLVNMFAPSQSQRPNMTPTPSVT